MTAKLKHEMIYHDWCPVQSVNMFGVDIVAPRTSDRDPVQYAAFLKCIGVKHFSFGEIITPNDQAKAARCGYGHFTPPGHCWALSGLVIRVADHLRTELGEPIHMRNHWRPQSYNRLVSKSSIESDHPNACAVDLDFGSESSLSSALNMFSLALVSAPMTLTGFASTISIGIGATSLHIGLYSPKGPRYWVYDSYKGEVPDAIKALGK